MNHKISILVLLCSGLLGCSPEDVKPEAKTDDGAAGSGAISPLGDGACTTGPQSCYCPDGTLSGTQYCDARQERSTCQCPDAVGAGPSAMGVQGDPTRVCTELAGTSGCDATSYVSPQVPASILFVVDRSGSMACNAPPVQSVEECNADPQRKDAAQPSRWETTVAALNEAFAGLSGSSASLGLSMFSTDGYCGVDSTPVVGVDAVSPVQLMALSDAMAASVPAGGTPIVGGVILAYSHLHEELKAPGNRYVVLITDGEESCGMSGDDTDAENLAGSRKRLLETEVMKAREANIKTFVIGAPGSEGARGFLSELAFLGGTARASDCQHGDPEGEVGDCHFDLSTQDDFSGVLRDSLGKISGEALGCEFQTPPGGSASINVQYSQNGATPSCFAHDPAPCDGGANGWQFAKHADGTDDLSRVVLCGAACDTVKADPTTVVDVILGCQSLE
jgi:hypothetical protein